MWWFCFSRLLLRNHHHWVSCVGLSLVLPGSKRAEHPPMFGFSTFCAHKNISGTVWSDFWGVPQFQNWQRAMWCRALVVSDRINICSAVMAALLLVCTIKSWHINRRCYETIKSGNTELYVLTAFPLNWRFAHQKVAATKSCCAALRFFQKHPARGAMTRPGPENVKINPEIHNSIIYSKFVYSLSKNANARRHDCEEVFAFSSKQKSSWSMTFAGLLGTNQINVAKTPCRACPLFVHSTIQMDTIIADVHSELHFMTFAKRNKRRLSSMWKRPCVGGRV